MKVEHISDINKFFDVVEQCKAEWSWLPEEATD